MIISIIKKAQAVNDKENGAASIQQINTTKTTVSVPIFRNASKFAIENNNQWQVE